MERPATDDDPKDSAPRRSETQKKRQPPEEDVSYEPDETDLSMSPQIDSRTPAKKPEKPTGPSYDPRSPVAGPSHAPDTPAPKKASAQRVPFSGTPVSATSAPSKRRSLKKIFSEKFGKGKSPKQMTYEEAVKQATKHQECENVWSEFVLLLKKYDRTFGWEFKNNPILIFTTLNQLVEKLDRSRKEIEIKPALMEKLPGIALSYEIKKQEQRISDLLHDFVIEKWIMLRELSEKDDAIAKLSAESAKDKKLVQLCKFGNLSTNKQAVAQLRAIVVEKDVVNKLLQEQVEKLRSQNVDLERRIDSLNEKMINVHKDAMKKYTDVVKDIKLNEDIYNYVIETQEHLEKNREDMEKDVGRRMVDGMKNALKEVKGEIDRLKEEAKEILEEHAERSVEVQNLSLIVNNLTHEAQKLEEIVSNKKEENRSLIAEIETLDEFRAGIDKTSTPKSFDQSRELAQESSQSSQQPWESDFESPERPRRGSPGAPGYVAQNLSGGPSLSLEDSGSQPIIHSQRGYPSAPGYVAPNRSGGPSLYLEDSGSQPIIHSQRDSSGAPGYVAPNRSGGPSLYLEDSGIQPIIPSLTLTPPSPKRSPDIFTSSTRSNVVGPGTQTLSQPQSRITIDPSTQNISGVTNRFDIGRTLNMQTVHSGSPSPYNQVTRVDSVISPQPGPSRMLDNPLHVQHRANIAPDGFKTPWISTQSRYGYTDPSYKMLNLPPGGFLEMDTGLKKKLMLMSPYRKEPLLVNIDVDPKPLVQTESGEHFICDISLDVQEAGKTKPPRISPVYTFDEPPAITPSANRWNGESTPPGIFKKRHYNVRRIEDKFDDSPGKYFPPHYLPHDGRSPVSHLSPVSLLSDRTISWERIPGVERTPSPVIKGPSWQYPGYIPSPLTESSLEESPIIQGRVDINSTDFSDSSFERTPPSPRLEGTFERSPSPVIRGYVDERSTDVSDSSFKRTPPYPRLEGTFERSPSPVIRRHVDYSSTPSTTGSFERSASPLMNRTFERSPSPLIELSFDGSQSPRLDGSTDPLNRVVRFRGDDRGNLDMISPPSTDNSFERSVSPQMNRTFEHMSSSPSNDGSFNRSSSPRIDGSFQRSLSPFNQVQRYRPDGRGFIEIDSSLSNNGGYDRSVSSLSNRPFDRSSSPFINRSFDESPSPVSNRTIDSSGHFYPLDTTYDSHSGRSTHEDPFYDGTSAQSPDSHMYGPSEDEFNRSMQSGRSFNHSVSPRTLYSSDMSSSSGYDNPFNPYNSGLSSSPSSPHTLNSSMPPRLGGVFNENPERLARTI